MKYVDDVVEAIYQRLCLRYHDGTNPTDRSMGFTELRVALGVTEALFNEALWVLSFPAAEEGGSGHRDKECVAG